MDLYLLSCLFFSCSRIIGIISYPPACESPIRPNTICERGKHADIFRLAFLDAWVWAVFCFLVLCMILIYSKLTKVDRASTPQESFHVSLPLPLRSNSNNNNNSAPDGGGGVGAGSAAATFNNSSSQHLQTILVGGTTSRQTANKPNGQQPQQPPSQPAPAPRRRSHTNMNRLKHQFAAQALLYALAFFITFFFETVVLILRATHTNASQLLMLCLFLANVFLPLQGFWNAFIYIRPRYLRYRKQQKQQQEREQQQEELHLHHQKRAEASRLAHAARLAAQRGFVSLLQALSAESEDDEDVAEEEENYKESEYTSGGAQSSFENHSHAAAAAADSSEAKIVLHLVPEENH